VPVLVAFVLQASVIVMRGVVGRAKLARFAKPPWLSSLDAFKYQPMENIYITECISLTLTKKSFLLLRF
jgi:hypothetical protein